MTARVKKVSSVDAGSAPGLDVVVDVSSTRFSDEGLAGFIADIAASALVLPGRRLLVCLPAGASPPAAAGRPLDVWAGDPVDGLASCLQSAAVDRVGLAIITGAWIPTSEVLAALSEVLKLDPLVGVAHPRFAVPATDDVWALPSVTGTEARGISRAAMHLLPEYWITPEIPSACTVLSPVAVLAVDTVPAHDGRINLASMLAQLRRLGYRNLVANRVVVPYHPIQPAPYQLAAPPDSALAADIRQGAEWLRLGPESRLESILVGSYRDGRPRLLIDARGMHPTHNGTAHAALGFIKGLDALGPPHWDLEVLVRSDAAKFHQLARAHPRLVFRHDYPAGPYLAVVHMNQPWGMGTVRELHGCSRFLSFFMHDTITWDTIYAAENERLGDTLRFVAAWADGLAFNSAFTRNRFDFRFRISEFVDQKITHLSLSTAEYQSRLDCPAEAAPYVFLMGNWLDHKDVDRTARTLTDAFPDLPVVALGGRPSADSRIRSIEPGLLSGEELDELLLGATAVVYPSHYEGFGLPVLRGLANGRTVIVRSSALWEEIAANASASGALVPFSDDAELVDALGRAIHHLQPRAMRLGAGIPEAGEPVGWRDCAARLIEHADEMVENSSASRWMVRDTALAAGG